MKDIISKIKKLLALSDRPGTLAEAKAAASRARALMDKHQVTLMDVQTEDLKDDFVEQESAASFTSATPQWAWLFATYVAEAFDCECLRTHFQTIKRKGSSFLFIGLREDAAVASFFFDRWANILHDRAVESVREEEGDDIAKDELAELVRVWMWGAGEGIKDQAKQDREVEARKDDRINALVHVKDAALQKYMQQNHPRTLKVDVAPDRTSGAWIGGYAEGRNLPLKERPVAKPKGELNGRVSGRKESNSATPRRSRGRRRGGGIQKGK